MMMIIIVIITTTTAAAAAAAATTTTTTMIMMMMIMMMIIIIIITMMMMMTIVIAFKGAIRDFLQSQCTANCLLHVRESGQGAIVCKSSATHRALITYNMSCYVPRGTK